MPHTVDEPNRTIHRSRTRKQSDPVQPVLNPPPVAPSTANRAFTADDFINLSLNEHCRYQKNSAKIGHLLISTDSAGTETGSQFHIPQQADSSAPDVRKLHNIERITPFGQTRYRAQSPNGTRMYATRFIDMDFSEDNSAAKRMRFASFSPPPAGKREPFWGSGKYPPFYRDDMQEEDKKEFDAECAEIPAQFKGGRQLTVEPDSVRKRDLIKNRKPDQNTVMGGSAKDCYAAFMESLQNELHPDMLEILARAVNAPLNNPFYGNYRPEWLHLEGHSLTPMSIDPQRKDNLAAGPRWANTEMMVLERVAKWYALNQPETFVKILPYFEMLLDSDLVQKIKFEVTFEEKNRFVRILQEINPFLRYPLFRKASDLAQSTAVVSSLLRGIPPVSRQVIDNTGGTLQPTAQHPTPRTEAPVVQPPIVHMEIENDRENIHRETSEMINRADPLLEMKNEQTLLNKTTYEPSVVQVETVFNMPDYTNPWQGVDTETCSGTGIVIEHDGRKYVLTNAHCVENAALIRIRLSTDRDKEFEARSLCTSYQCDLALLEVMSRKFSNRVEAARIGGMVSQQADVYTVGYPIGGDEICITKGIVSRIESDTYSMSGLEMLQVQVDSAINSGNSGGPVFGADGRVVGVAFQGLNRAQSVGYMIPVPIVNHFLQEVFSGRPYRGFPVLPVSFEQMKNATLRQYYGMGKKDRGVRIRRVDKLSDAYSKLQRNDILLAIDGLPVSNTGKVDVLGIGKNIRLSHITQMKFIGDSVSLTILRQNLGGTPELHDISITLDHIPYDFRRVPAEEHDKMPCYFIAAGIALIPLTRNYLEDGGADLEEVYYADLGCRLKDLEKENPDDQIILINDVFECRDTRGYRNIHRNAIVREINGRKVSHIHDAIDAIESCREPVHCFITNKGRIVVKNMNPAEHAALLAKYKINFDRSEDLRPAPAAPSPVRVESDSSDSDSPLLQPFSSHLPPAPLVLKRTQPQRDMNPVRRRAILIDDSEVSDNSESKANSHRSPLPVREQARSNTPGFQRYNEKIDRMLEFYSQFPLDDDSAEDLDYADEASPVTGSESLSPEGSEAEESDGTTAPAPITHKRKRHHAFFRDNENSDSDNGATPIVKRYRGSTV